jgi:hypothetical protein
MRVPLIGSIDANTGETGPFPAIGNESKIVIIQTDGDRTKEFNVDKVVCMDLHTPDRKDGRCFDFDEPAPGTWEITCTDNRILFHNPGTVGRLFGNKAKVKPGKCTAGHLYYSQIGGLSTGYTDANSPFFSATCVRVDGTFSHILIFSKNLETLKTLAVELHSRISEYLAKENLTDSSVKKEIVSNWNEYESKLWDNTENDIRFTVPTKEFQAVANSRMSAM